MSRSSASDSIDAVGWDGKPSEWGRKRGASPSRESVLVVVIGVLIGGSAGLVLTQAGNGTASAIASKAKEIVYGHPGQGDVVPGEETASLGIGCNDPTVVDGDTLRCGSTRIRLEGIDAPELPGHCRPGRECTPGDPYASTANLQSLVNGGAMTCEQSDTDVYGRAVARCRVNGRDLSCAQMDGGYAVRRYGFILC